MSVEEEYAVLGKQLATATLYFVGNPLDWQVEYRRDKGILTWHKEDPVPTLEQLQEALWKGDWTQVRIHRDELLTATDFYALSDVTMTSDMTTYRQALRDLPASTADSGDVVWPTKP